MWVEVGQAPKNVRKIIALGTDSNEIINKAELSTR